MSNLISITVDGREVQVPPRTQLIEALRQQAQVETPAFCYHQDLSVAGNCRICLVEVEGPRGFAFGIACHMQAAPGMKVRTQHSSERVQWARRGVMESLLVNHPLDCPICDKAGECTLQEHYMGQGKHESRLTDAVGKTYKGGADHRFVDTKGVTRGGKAIDLGPTIVLDQERCIVCSRCVRFMDEVAKSPQLAIAGRGDHAYITTFPDQPLDHGYDLNTTDICPVGALTGKHFRFQQRVWNLKSVESIDPSDSFGANITIEYSMTGEGGTVWRLMPRRNPDVNKSWIANRTRLLYEQLATNRQLEGSVAGAPTTLANAERAAAEAIGSAKRIAIVTSGHATMEDNAAALALAASLGTKASVFGGSFLAVGTPDGIAMTNDPVANRRGVAILGISDNLTELVKRASEFDLVITFHHDLFADPQAAPIAAIPQRIVLDAWQTVSLKQATIGLGVRAWAEIRGTMVNHQQRIQLLQACPVVPNHELDPAWAVLSRLAGKTWTSEIDAWKHVVSVATPLQHVTYRSIGPMGQDLKSVLTQTVAVAAGGAA